jgi:alpha-glucosidase
MTTISMPILTIIGVALLTVVLASAGQSRPAAEHRVMSPDGRLVFVLSDAGGLNYRVEVDGQPLLKPSHLGLQFAGGVTLGPAAVIRDAKRSKHDGSWENHFGQRRIVCDRWNQAQFNLEQAGTPTRHFGIIVRMFDDGVAFRYELPGASKLGEFTLTRELTEFAFAGDYRCWAGEPSNCAENQYPERTLCTIPLQSTGKDGTKHPYLSTLPLTVQAPMACVAVAESDLLDWAGMFLTGTGSPTIAVTLASRGDSRGCVVSRAPRMSPWRVLMIGRTAADLVASDLIATLATPSRLSNVSWVEPGIAAWDPWWTGINSTQPEHTGLRARGDTRAHMEYIDFAAEMGWPYQLVDWYWYQNMTPYEITLNLGQQNPPRPPVDFTQCAPHVDLPAVFVHAKQRGVRLFIWLHSYDVHRYGVDKACALFARMGAPGLKIDFMNSDSQETVQWYEHVLKTAARHKLMIDFHGAYKPTGLARTWPNYIAQEGVLGNEYNKIELNKCTPQHTITLPFTRGLLGPMDFTPGGFINRTAAEFKITQPAEVIGTRARQLAMPVIYLSPLLVLCDSPKNYRGAAGIEFYRGLPTVWDESVVLSAELGRHIVIARRSGDRWWLAAMNSETPLKVRVPLKFLGSGPWRLQSFADTAEGATKPEQLAEREQTITASDTLELDLAPVGGYAASSTSMAENNHSPPRTISHGRTRLP